MTKTGFPALLAGMAFSVSILSCSPREPLAQAAALYERDLSAGLYDIGPVRGEPRPLRLHRDGDEFECSICHEGFSGDLGDAALQGEHKDLQFNHGLNLRCLNCHHPTNSMAYVYHDGSEIPDDQPNRLCAKCHGPHYREWLLDIHGRVNERWDGRGEPTKLNCIQCHNPHHPRFEPMAPEPPPTLTRFDAQPQGGPLQ
ncbi:MAG: hypothetical protein HYZ00_05005 [Candidatus Hydrogenedentes bacterium]|nr:hypothetical protein [Candidatus Hydrogenedentota bacterium]